MKNILLSDDHSLFRDGMRGMLCQIFDDICITEASDYITTLSNLRHEKNFDLIIIDFLMPGGDPFDSLSQVVAESGGARCIVMSALEDPLQIRHCFEIGVKGYISKGEGRDVIYRAIQLVDSGGVYLPPTLLNSDAIAGSSIPDVTPLTRRQHEILLLIQKGLSNKEIARQLNLTEATVKAHVTTMFKTLNVKNRTQAASSLPRHN